MSMDVSNHTNVWNESVSVIRLPEGRLTAANGNEVRQQLYQLLAEYPHHIVLDMSDIAFIDSVGVAVLLSVSRRAGSHRCLMISNMQTQAKVTFDLLDFGKVFSLFETLDEAIAGCKPKAS